MNSTLFHNVISGLWKDKLVLLVTNHPQHLPLCSKILFVDDGQVLTFHSFKELTAANLDLSLIFASEQDGVKKSVPQVLTEATEDESEIETQDLHQEFDVGGKFL